MEIVALSAYRKAVKKLLTDTERTAMESSIANDPLAHPVIPATGGVRAIFYYFVAGATVYLYDIYAKNQKENLTREEENHLRSVADGLERPDQL